LNELNTLKQIQTTNGDSNGYAYFKLKNKKNF